MSLKSRHGIGGQDKEQSRAHDPQSQDLEVHRRQVMGCFLEDGPELMGFEIHAHEQGDLLGDDQQTDGRQHALDGGRREDGAQAGHLQPGEDQLHQAGEANGDQHERVTRLEHFVLAGVLAQVNAPQPDHAGEQRRRQAGGRAADRHVRPTQEREHEAGDDRGDDPAYRRCAGGYGDPHRKRQRDHRHHEPRTEIIRPMLQTHQTVLGLLHCYCRINVHEDRPFGLRRFFRREMRNGLYDRKASHRTAQVVSRSRAPPKWRRGDRADGARGLTRACAMGGARSGRRRIAG